jgi:hypothetical protein
MKKGRWGDGRSRGLFHRLHICLSEYTCLKHGASALRRILEAFSFVLRDIYLEKMKGFPIKKQEPTVGGQQLKTDPGLGKTN